MDATTYPDSDDDDTLYKVGTFERSHRLNPLFKESALQLLERYKTSMLTARKNKNQKKRPVEESESETETGSSSESNDESPQETDSESITGESSGPDTESPMISTRSKRKRNEEAIEEQPENIPHTKKKRSEPKAILPKKGRAVVITRSPNTKTKKK